MIVSMPEKAPAIVPVIIIAKLQKKWEKSPEARLN